MQWDIGKGKRVQAEDFCGRGNAETGFAGAGGKHNGEAVAEHGVGVVMGFRNREVRVVDSDVAVGQGGR